MKLYRYLGVTMLVGACQLFAPLAHAADPDGNFAIKGGGLQTCQKLLSAWDSKSDDLALYGGWIDGYVTGLNQRLDQTFDVAPWQTTETMLGLLRLSCQNATPDTKVVDAFDDIVRALLPARLPAASGVVVVQNENNSLVLYSEILVRVNKALTERGYGTLEGADFSETTIAALKKFQRENELEESGLPDQATLAALFFR